MRARACVYHGVGNVIFCEGFVRTTKWMAPTMAHGVFGAGSGFRVGWRAMGGGGGLVSALQGFYCSISKAFILSGRLGVGLSFYGV